MAYVGGDTPLEAYVPDPNIVSRARWGAEPPREPGKPLGHNVAFVVATLFTDTPPCNNKTSCCNTVKEIQRKHLDEGDTDIKYNFLIGSDGRIYEGRGWDVQSSTLLQRPDGLPKGRRRFDIAFIGDWRYLENPDLKMIDPSITLITYAVKHRCIKKAYRYFDLDKRIV